MQTYKMKDSTNGWTENKAKGNISESIIEFLINSTPDWKCIKYGMENHIEELKKSLKSNSDDDISKKIRTMPDFIAINEKTNKVLLIDVKFRSFIDRREPKKVLYGFSYAQMKDYLQFWKETYLIIVHNHKSFFTVIPLSEVEWHKHFHSRTKNNGHLYEQWNFAGIQKSIHHLFPNLPDSEIKKAIEMIPKK